MRNIMLKEIKLSASPLAFIFIAFGLMFMVPGYPILCAAFFVTLGLFHSFQNAREANDIVFSALLPCAKNDVVKGKFSFVCAIEGCGFLLMAVAVIIRMAVFADAAVYRQNALMNANLFALGAALLLFGMFNLIFLGGFFKTAYNLGKPFITYIIVCFILIFAFEALHHIPGLGMLNAFGTDSIGLQGVTLVCGFFAYVVLTYLSYRSACRNFERIDL